MRIKYVPKDYTIAQIAYMAGIVDGEGALTAGSYAKTKKGSPQYTIYLIISSTDECLIDWLVNTFGGKKYMYTRAQTPSNSLKTVFKWQATGYMLQHICELILPYSVMKTRQIQIILELLATSKLRYYEKGQRGPSVLPEVTELRMKLCQELRNLHCRRGSLPI